VFGSQVLVNPSISAGSGVEYLRSVDEQLYILQHARAPGKKEAKTIGNRIFIGHGQSLVCRELKDFLEDDLHLPVDEFNREPSAGKSTVERLNEMLDNAGFALLVMTGEDEQPSGRVRARENVAHEAGLFQGRLSFKRAIILLEDGCQTFSNIAGLTVIPFPKGHIRASYQEIRRTLEREGVLPTGRAPITAAPSRANSTATALPSPHPGPQESAPVTMATLPLSREQLAA
jgi:predicted nucleotide-binding protein